MKVPDNLILRDNHLPFFTIWIFLWLQKSDTFKNTLKQNKNKCFIAQVTLVHARSETTSINAICCMDYQISPPLTSWFFFTLRANRMGKGWPEVLLKHKLDPRALTSTAHCHTGSISVPHSPPPHWPSCCCSHRPTPKASAYSVPCRDLSSSEQMWDPSLPRLGSKQPPLCLASLCLPHSCGGLSQLLSRGIWALGSWKFVESSSLVLHIWTIKPAGKGSDKRKNAFHLALWCRGCHRQAWEFGIHLAEPRDRKELLGCLPWAPGQAPPGHTCMAPCSSKHCTLMTMQRINWLFHILVFYQVISFRRTRYESILLFAFPSTWHNAQHIVFWETADWLSHTRSCSVGHKGCLTHSCATKDG